MSSPEHDVPIPGATLIDLPHEAFHSPFHRTIGVQLALGPEREGIAFVMLDPERHYGARWAHGGLVGALADIASGVVIALALPNPMYGIDGTISLNTNYIRKAREGPLAAVARLVRLGRRIATTEVDVINEGALVARALGTFMLAPHAFDAPGEGTGPPAAARPSD